MNAWMIAVLAVLVALGVIVAGRRRAARRAAEAEARARARRRRLPEVSANLRGQAAGARDLWQEDAAHRVAPDPAGTQITARPGR